MFSLQISQIFNAAAEKIFGYTASEVLGTDISIILGDTTLERLADEENADLTDLQGKHKEGFNFPVMISCRKSMFQGITNIFIV